MSLKTYVRKDEVVKHYWAVSLKKKISIISGLNMQAHYPHSHVQRQKARVGRAVKYLSPLS